MRSPPSQPTLPPQPTSPVSGPSPQPKEQSSSAEYPGPLAPVTSRVAELLHDLPQLAQRQKEPD